jgi:hypothetical protein
MSGFGAKQTCAGAVQMSAFDPKRTLKAASLPHLHDDYGPSGYFSPSGFGSEFPPKHQCRRKRINAMVDIILKTEDEIILAFDVSDEALEIAAGTVSDKTNFTWGVCTALGSQIGCPG